MQPYTISWTEKGVEKTKTVSGFDPFYLERLSVTLRLKEKQVYQFHISDKLGCKYVSSEIHNTVLETNITYEVTENCDSLTYYIDVPYYRSLPIKVRTTFQNTDSSNIGDYVEWQPGFSGTIPYNFKLNILVRDSLCLVSEDSEWFKPELEIIHTKQPGCSGPDGKGQIGVVVTNFEPQNNHRMFWNDIETDTILMYRTLDEGTYTVNVLNEDGCGVSEEVTLSWMPSFEVKYPDLLCADDTAYIVPQIDGILYDRLFYKTDVLDLFIDSIPFIMSSSSDTTLGLYYLKDGCYSKRVDVTIHGTEYFPLALDTTLVWCKGVDSLILTSPISSTQWYSTGYASLLQVGDTMNYATSFELDTIMVYLQSNNKQCTSDTSVIYVKQSNFDATVSNSNILTMKEGVSPYSIQVSGDMSYGFFTKDSVINLNDSINIGGYTLMVSDSIGCKVSLSDINVLGLFYDYSKKGMVYPNPVTSTLYFNEVDALSKDFRVFNLNGELVYKGVLVDEEFDFSEFSTGTYFIQIENLVFKVVKD